MARMTYDGRSLMIDGQRIWLTSGSVHYFRIPSPLWHDSLLKARRGGLNCISTYVPWALHEPVEGQWDFSGDRDVVEFIRLANELGLYVILRPGPYICSEFDFGGLPAWLAAKPNIQVRTSNAACLHYYEKYLRQVLPRLVDFQASRGGPIVAVQNENEYQVTTMPDREQYLGHLARLIRGLGFDVPMLTCNALSEPLLQDAIECVCGWDRNLVQLRKLRQLQPASPSVVSEYWCGDFDCWGGPHHARDPREVARRALEMLGAGAQVNYYVFHGGTNFGFGAGRHPREAACYVTTSYDYDAPIAEGGGLTPKYYRLRPVNLLGTQFSSLLAAAQPVESAYLPGGLATLASAGPRGRLTVVTNGGDDSRGTASLVLHDGTELEVDLSHIGAAAILTEADLTDRHTLSYSNLMPLGLFGARILVLHGRAGQEGVIAINERVVRVRVPDRTPMLTEVDGLPVVVMSTPLAERTWWADGRLLIGPDYVGEDESELTPSAEGESWTIAGETKLTLRKLPARGAGRSAAKLKAPKLAAWRRIAGCPEPDPQADLPWQRLARPQDLTKLGVPQGYGWYRAVVRAPRATHKRLYLPQCADRATVWVNGKRVGVWGLGEGAVREPMPIALERGENTLTFLADNLGRLCAGAALGEPKGIWGGLYSATPIRLKAWQSRRAEQSAATDRMVPRAFLGLLPLLHERPVQTLRNTFTLAQPVPVHVQYAALAGYTVAVQCNGRPVSFTPEDDAATREAWLVGELQKGGNELTILVWGEIDAARLKDVALHRMDEEISEGAAWAFRPWQPPVDAAEPGPREGPAWFATTFACPPGDSPPLFLRLAGGRKGQIYVNGINAGRYWSAGPQSAYYLPSPWLKDVNQLLIFDEAGQAPTGSKLEFLPQGPYG